jgi:epoxyqueuosine reductase
LSPDSTSVLSAEAVKQAAHDVGFALVGLARAEPLDPAPLRHWLAAGYAAGLAAMRTRFDERLDPGVILPGARTVIVLGIPYGEQKPSGGLQPVIARYARGRDYHYAHRDRMRRLRHRLRTLAPALDDYACVDSGAAMEKAWAERAGVGFIGKNGMVINQRFGSWFTLSVMVIDHEVDHYDEPHPRLCGDCERCLRACPTQALPSPGVVDCRRCLAYHTVENHDPIPEPIAERLRTRAFGCDVCQTVCPFNRGELPEGDPTQAPRPLGLMDAAAIAALSEEDYDRLSTGTPMRRIGYHGLRRNACLSLGSTRAQHARALLERLATDPSELVRDAAIWALGRLGEG